MQPSSSTAALHDHAGGPLAGHHLHPHLQGPYNPLGWAQPLPMAHGGMHQGMAHPPHHPGALAPGATYPPPAPRQPPFTFTQSHILLVTDLDDTLVCGSGEVDPSDFHDAGTAALRDCWLHARRAMAEHRPAAPFQGTLPHVPPPPQPVVALLAFNTGRTLPLFERLVQEKGHCLPHPDALICGCGTRIYVTDPVRGSWVEDVAWTQFMSQGWDSPTIAVVVDDLIQEAVAEGHDVAFADDVEQHEHKLTVRMPAGEVSERLLGAIRSGLTARGVQFRTIVGTSRDGCESYLDLLPAQAGKGNAAEYLRRRFGLPASAMVVAGDSYNDADMLQTADQAIIVGNCIPDLRTWALQLQGQWQMHASSAPGANQQRKQQQQQQPADASAKHEGTSRRKHPRRRGNGAVPTSNSEEDVQERDASTPVPAGADHAGGAVAGAGGAKAAGCDGTAAGGRAAQAGARVSDDSSDGAAQGDQDVGPQGPIVVEHFNGRRVVLTKAHAAWGLIEGMQALGLLR